MQKAKQFDDGLYAAVELAALHGCGDRVAKTAWLARLRRALGTDQVWQATDAQLNRQLVVVLNWSEGDRPWPAAAGETSATAANTNPRPLTRPMVRDMSSGAGCG